MDLPVNGDWYCFVEPPHYIGVWEDTGGVGGIRWKNGPNDGRVTFGGRPIRRIDVIEALVLLERRTDGVT